MTEQTLQAGSAEKPGPSIRRPRSARGATVPAAVAGFWLVLVALIGAFAPLLAPYDSQAINLSARLVPPIGFGGSPTHLLGTDELGRDVLSRLLVSIRTSLMIAGTGVFVGAIVGITLGLFAAHFRGIVDEAVMMFVDVQAALPFLIVALTAVAFFGGSFILLVIVVGLHGWERYARLARSLALSTTSRNYVVAAATLGAGRRRIYLRHVLPNIASALLVNFTLSFPEIMLLESSLSFLGLGVQPPETSLGSMLGFGRNHLINSWWLSVLPGIVIFITALAMCVLGDELRDRLDPTLR